MADARERKVDQLETKKKPQQKSNEESPAILEARSRMWLPFKRFIAFRVMAAEREGRELLAEERRLITLMRRSAGWPGLAPLSDEEADNLAAWFMCEVDAALKWVTDQTELLRQWHEKFGAHAAGPKPQLPTSVHNFLSLAEDRICGRYPPRLEILEQFFARYPHDKRRL